MKEILEVQNMYGGYTDENVLNDISFLVQSDEMVAVAGPNGCGKSSLVRGICNLLPLQKGNVKINGVKFLDLGRREFARRVAVVPQDVHFQFHFTVEELVMMGRIPHIPRFRPYSGNDLGIVHQSLEQVGLIQYRHRSIHTLSGGEKQRVSIAQALAQQPLLLILDEPTAFLDLSHQLEIMELLQKLGSEHDISVFLTSHDLNLASLFCTRIMMMKNGSFVSDGKPKEIITPRLLKNVYGVDSTVISHPDGDVPHLMLRRKSTGPRGKNEQN